MMHSHFLIIWNIQSSIGFPIAQLVKNPPAIQETLVQFLGWEDPLEKEKATHSSILAWRIPWTIQPNMTDNFHFPSLSL